MLNAIGLGFAIVILGLLFSCIFGDIDIATKISGATVAICLGFGAIFSGLLGSGDRIRANYSTEDNEERKRRTRWISKLLLVGLPNLLAVIVYITFM